MPSEASGANGVATNPELNIEKLHTLPSEQQILSLFAFVTDIDKHVASLDADGCSAHQVYVKKELFKVITLSSPAPTRVIRNTLGRCFARIFGIGDRKLLFESINELVSLLTGSKSDKEFKTKHVAVSCLGAVFEAAGDSAISLAPLVCSSILRLLKVAQVHTSFRSALFRALGKIVKGIGRSADETITRDIWKQARNAATGDRAVIVQASACFCLEQLYCSTSFFDNPSDFDKLQSVIWKVFENAPPSLRRTAASCYSAVLVKSFSATPSQTVIAKPKIKRSKTKGIDNDDMGEELERTSSPTPGKPAQTLSLSLQDIFKILGTQYCRISTTNKSRAGIAMCYIRVVTDVPVDVVESGYGAIFKHFTEDLLGSPTILNNRYRLLMTRTFIRLIFQETIGAKLLNEAQQLDSVRYLSNSVLKDYPQSDVKERPEPAKETLIMAVDACRSLVEGLGSAISIVGDLCRGALYQVLEHPSYSVQVHAARALKTLVLASPQQLLPTATLCMNGVSREIGFLTGSRRSPRRCIGFAFGLAAIISTAGSQPLYGSVDIYARILSQATSILKSSSDSDLRISSTQIQVAWILIGSLMSLGPSFIKIHLSQLLLLWKNALPKPLSKDNIGNRGLRELSFLAHVRECALGSISAFMTYNSRLLTLDVSKRLATMLQNTTMFLNSLPAKKTTDDVDKRLTPALQLQDYDFMVRRRVFACYNQLVNLSPEGNHEALLQSSILTIAVSALANPENLSNASLSSSIATSTGALESIWDMADNSGFGITGLVNDLNLAPEPDRQAQKREHWSTQHSEDAVIDRTIRTPTAPAPEHDYLLLYCEGEHTMLDPLQTGVVNSAIRLFATSLPFQSPRIQESVLEQTISFLAVAGSQQNTLRRSAIAINIGAALFYALRVANSSRGAGLRSPESERAMQELLHGFLVYPDRSVRHLGALVLGHLCKNSGNESTTKEITYLIDLIVTNADPHARAGCATALGYINSELGGMAAGFHLENTLSILSQLAADAHPVVHFWALDALSRLADSSGLAFSGHVISTLGLLAQLYTLESHGTETSSLPFSNLEDDLSTSASITRCVNSLINVLGPDVQDVSKARHLIFTMTHQFGKEVDPLLIVQNLKCMEGLSLYAAGYVSFEPYVQELADWLSKDDPDICACAMAGLYALMRKGAEEVVRAARPGFEEQLWLMLNDSYGKGIMRTLVGDWIQQTSLTKVDVWVRRLQFVLTKLVTKANKTAPEQATDGLNDHDVQDDEVAGFAASAVKSAKDSSTVGSESSQGLLRWQVRAAAIDGLHEILCDFAREQNVYATTITSVLQPRIGDIVRIAFSASTSAVNELRVGGIRIIGRVLEIFGRIPDPDFPEATLLEQYQAQISSALTPAFAADSSPQLAAEAVAVCGSFISTGIVTDVDRMGRILRLLVSALEDFSRDSESAGIGDLKGLSFNAQTMVKLAVFSAWAELQIASREHQYLEDVVQPHLIKLTPLWLASLREYARLKFEPDVSNVGAPGALAGGLDVVYAALSRDTLLTFYQATWLNFVDAIASLIEQDSDFVFDALDGRGGHSLVEGKTPSAQDINYRDEPVAFFFVLFGISFEALIGRSTSDAMVSKERTLDMLKAMQKILRPSVAGYAIYQEAIFSESMDLFDRLALTEGPDIQAAIVEIARDLALAHPSACRSNKYSDPNKTQNIELLLNSVVSETEVDGQLSDDIDQLFELTRIIVLVISKHVPNLFEDNSTPRPDMTPDTVALTTLALTSLVDAASVFPSVIKGDLHACILHIFATIFSSPACQASIVPEALPIFRRFITTLVSANSVHTIEQIRSALARFLIILGRAQKREHEASVMCERNILLASTILIAASVRLLPPEDPLVTAFVDELADCLANKMTTRVAAGLARSLLLLPATEGAGSTVVARLLPRLITFLVAPSEIEDTVETRPIVSQALCAFALQLDSGRRNVALAVVVPALLQRASVEGESVCTETSARLLALAKGSPEAFKAIIGQMDGSQKAFLEDVIRKGGAANSGENHDRREGAGEIREPTIALKMDF